MRVTIYVEGGGDTKQLQAQCRKSFSTLINRAGFTGRSPAIVPRGGRRAAYESFKTDLLNRRSEYALLLVDSEDPVANPDENPDSDTAWKHLKKRDGWERPARAVNDQAQLMATCMETWVMADQAAVKRFFGSALQASALLPLLNLEARGRHEVQQALEHATRNCGRDRSYAKGKKSFAVLATLDPATLQQHLPHFRRLVATLNRCLA
ncbi:MAG: DUF4276 family protein [Acidobacteria bacterium]|nr:DUF4276 family protein [Acidobacteriota bacterium]